MKSDCEEANQDPFHLFGASSRPETLQPRAVSQVPARTTTHDQPLQSRLNALLRRARDLQPRTLSPSSPSHYLFSRRPFGFGFDGGVSDPNARSRRRPTERAGRHLEPDARPNDFCNCITTHGRVHERVIFAPAAGVPAASFPAPASLRPHMRGGEPCVPDRLEDRTPISCEWAEKEHTGRRAEPKVESDAPGIAFLGACSSAAQSR